MYCEYMIELINARSYITDYMIIYKDHFDHQIIARNVLYEQENSQKFRKNYSHLSSENVLEYCEIPLHSVLSVRLNTLTRLFLIMHLPGQD